MILNTKPIQTFLNIKPVLYIIIQNQLLIIRCFGKTIKLAKTSYKSEHRKY